MKKRPTGLVLLADVPAIIEGLGYRRPSMKTVYGWQWIGLETHKVGGRVYITTKEIKRWLRRTR